MWETTSLGDSDLLWAATNFMGGIAGQREGVCGALSGGAIFLGLRHRVPAGNKQAADEARKKSVELARGLVDGFAREFGNIGCGRLIGIDFTDEAAVKRYRDSGEWMRKCNGYVKYVIEALYQMEA